MKTVTLDEEAYARLKAWKRGAGDSFSQVVKRVVPEPGTLGAFLSFVEAHGTDRLPGNEVLEASVEARPAAKPDPWTS
jgi:predicted CopG family antitoxin